MKRVSKPVEEVKEVFEECISSFRNNESNNFLQDRLRSIKALIIESEIDYEKSSNLAEWYQVPVCDEGIDLVSCDEIKKVYTNKLAHVKASARKFYDKLRVAAENNICPFCGQRTVTTLDHYLPQSKYLKFVVTPINLVPACADCNKIKLSKVPESSKKQVLHPYFDDTTSAQWLFAKVIDSEPATINFYTNAPKCWNDSLRHRVQHHFLTFDLARLYISHAAVEMCNIHDQLHNLYETGGRALLKEYLKDCASSRYIRQKNSWQTATYQAISESDWFCDGGYFNPPTPI